MYVSAFSWLRGNSGTSTKGKLPALFFACNIHCPVNKFGSKFRIVLLQQQKLHDLKLVRRSTFGIRKKNGSIFNDPLHHFFAWYILHGTWIYCKYFKKRGMRCRTEKILKKSLGKTDWKNTFAKKIKPKLQRNFTAECCLDCCAIEACWRIVVHI